MGPAIQYIQCCMKDVIGAIAAHLLHGEEAGSGLQDADYTIYICYMCIIYIYFNITIYIYRDSLICPNASTRYSF